MSKIPVNPLFNLEDCIHCGLCLSSCPTYLVNGLESENPRGRVLLMSLAEHGDLLPEETTAHIDACLDCRACETACPSGVDYHHLLDRFHSGEEQSTGFIRNAALQLVLSRRRMGWLFTLAWLGQKLQILPLLARVFPVLRGLPQITPHSFMDTAAAFLPAIGPRKGAAAFFTGCVMDPLYAPVHEAAVRILRWNGYDVHIPPDQTCCGAIHHHSGGRTFLPELQARNIAVFGEYDLIVNNSAGCGAELKEYPDTNFTSRIRDISEFLCSIALKAPTQPTTERAVYDAPCHLMHGQGIETEPVDLLTRFGYELADFPQSALCCGAAGSYMITHTHMSGEILKMKMADIAACSDATLIITANPGCQLQLSKGCEQYAPDRQVLHICQALDRIYQRDDEYREAFSLH